MNKHHRIDADAFAKLIVPHQTKLTATAFAYLRIRKTIQRRKISSSKH